MSEYTSFQIDSFELSSTPSYADPETLSLFQESDKHVRLRAIIEGRRWTSSWLSAPVAQSALSQTADGRWLVHLPPQAVWEEEEEGEADADISDAGGDAEAAGSTGDDDGSSHGGDDVPRAGADHGPGLAGQNATSIDVEREVELDIGRPIAGHAYISTVARVRDRLEVMGFTLAAADVLDDFVRDRLERIASLEPEDSFLAQAYAEERDALQSLTIASWLDAYGWIVARRAQGIDRWGRYKDVPYYVPADQAPLLVRYLLHERGEHDYGFPYDDVRYLYRAALEVSAPDRPVLLDLSRVSLGWAYEATDAVVEDARLERLVDHPSDAPTIVLTEGITDQRALQAALQLLYPHLADLYTFLDFESMRVRGGAPALVGMIKAFAAAGITNRVVALFDNDTAAHSALRELRGIALPSNMRVLPYPPLPLAAAYPSIGPHGVQLADVNGAAGSLELYFGEDVLRETDGALTPVQWGSFDHVLQRYQGELRDKARLQERFAAKVAAAESTPTKLAEQDWSGMRAILDALRTAFI